MTLPSDDAAILRTLLYADIFDYPLTPAEIRHYLIAQSVSLETVERALESSPWLAGRVTRVNGYYVMRGRTDIVQALVRGIAAGLRRRGGPLPAAVSAG